jgi:hypothetical protein
MKSGHLLAGPPAVVNRLTNRSIWPISSAMRPVSPSAMTIFLWHLWLQQNFRTDAISRVTELCSIKSERGNTIYVHSGPSGAILTFLIHFEFYPTKRSRFEKLSLPVFLEFDLVFYMIFHNFQFFKKLFRIWNPKITEFWIRSCLNLSNFCEILKNWQHFLTLEQGHFIKQGLSNSKHFSRQGLKMDHHQFWCLHSILANFSRMNWSKLGKKWSPIQQKGPPIVWPVAR